MRVSISLFFLLPLFCFSQSVKVNAYDKFLKKHRVETEPVVLQSTSASQVAVGFTSLASTLFVEVSGWGWGAATIDADDDLIFLLSNDSTVTAKSVALQTFEPGIDRNTYKHRYFISGQDLQALINFDLVGLKKYSFKEFSRFTVPGKNVGRVRQLGTVFLNELRKANILTLLR
jgi:hypothetical protein